MRRLEETLLTHSKNCITEEEAVKMVVGDDYSFCDQHLECLKQFRVLFILFCLDLIM